MYLEATPSHLGWPSTHPFSAELTWEWQGQGSAPVPPGGWLDGCPGSLPGMYPHAWIHAGCARVVGSRTWCSCRAGVYTSNPGSDPVHQREDQLPLWSTVPAPHGPSCLCPAPLHVSFHRDLCSSGEGDSATTLADRTVSKKMFAWAHWGWIGILAHIMVPGLHQQPLAQWQIHLSLPFPSRKTSMQISLMKCPNGVHRCMESLQALGMKFTKICLLMGKWPIWRCVPVFSNNNSKPAHY